MDEDRKPTPTEAEMEAVIMAAKNPARKSPAQMRWEKNVALAEKARVERAVRKKPA